MQANLFFSTPHLGKIKNHQISGVGRAYCFAKTRDRTGDLQIFSLTLSQLSYRGYEVAKKDGWAPKYAPTPHLKVQHFLQLCMLCMFVAPFITASLAQLAEHARRKRMVVGSIPTGGWP